MNPGRGQPSRSDLSVRFVVICESYAICYSRQIRKISPHVNRPIDRVQADQRSTQSSDQKSDSGKTKSTFDGREVRNIMARPDNLTPEIAKRFEDAIRVGAPNELAAAAAGISMRTVYRWEERGETNTSGKYWHRSQ